VTLGGRPFAVAAGAPGGGAATLLEPGGENSPRPPAAETRLRLRLPSLPFSGARPPATSPPSPQGAVVRLAFASGDVLVVGLFDAASSEGPQSKG